MKRILAVGFEDPGLVERQGAEEVEKWQRLAQRRAEGLGEDTYGGAQRSGHQCGAAQLSARQTEREISQARAARQSR